MKSILKLICVFSLACLAYSCTKSSSSNSSYYLQANFDATVKTFNGISVTSPVIAVETPDGTGGMDLTISGFNNMPASGIPNSTTEEAVLILRSDKSEISAGTTFTGVAQNGSTINEFVYTTQVNNAVPASVWASAYDFSAVNESITCTITEATSSYIKGTFSTIIYQGVASPIASKTVTGGQFYAKIVPQ